MLVHVDAPLTTKAVEIRGFNESKKNVVLLMHIERSGEDDVYELEIMRSETIPDVMLPRIRTERDADLLQSYPMQLLVAQSVPGQFGRGHAFTMEDGSSSSRVATVKSRPLSRDSESLDQERRLVLTTGDKALVAVEGKYCGGQCFLFVIPQETVIKKAMVKCILHRKKSGDAARSAERVAFSVTVSNVRNGAYASFAFASVLHIVDRSTRTQSVASATSVYRSLLHGLNELLVGFVAKASLKDEMLLWLHSAVVKFAVDLPIRYLPLSRNAALAVIAAASPALFAYPILPLGGIGQVVQMVPKGDLEGFSLHEAVGLQAVLMHFLSVVRSPPSLKVATHPKGGCMNSNLDFVRSVRLSMSFLMSQEFSPEHQVPSFAFSGLLALAHMAPPVPSSDVRQFRKGLVGGNLTTYLGEGYRGHEQSEGWHRRAVGDFQPAVAALKRREYDVAYKGLNAMQQRDIDAVTSKMAETQRVLIIWREVADGMAHQRTRDCTLLRTLGRVVPQNTARGDRVRRQITESTLAEFDEAWATLLLAQRCDTLPTVSSAEAATGSQSQSQSQPLEERNEGAGGNDLFATADRALGTMAPAIASANELVGELTQASIQYRTSSAAFKRSQEERTKKNREQPWSAVLMHIPHSEDFAWALAQSADSADRPDDALQGAVLALSRPAGGEFSHARVNTRKPPHFTSMATLRDAHNAMCTSLRQMHRATRCTWRARTDKPRASSRVPLTDRQATWRVGDSDASSAAPSQSAC